MTSVVHHRSPSTSTAGGVAALLEETLRPFIGGALPVRLVAWDGSQAGPEDAPVVELRSPLDAVPEALSRYELELSRGGDALTYTYDNQADRPGVASLLRDLEAAGIPFRDIDTKASSLEEIFVSLVRKEP